MATVKNAVKKETALTAVNESNAIKSVGNTGLKFAKQYEQTTAKGKIIARIDALKKVKADAVAFCKVVNDAKGINVKGVGTINTMPTKKGLDTVKALAVSAYKAMDFESIGTTGNDWLLGEAGSYSAIYSAFFVEAMGWTERVDADAMEKLTVNPKHSDSLKAIRAQAIIAVGSKPAVKKATVIFSAPASHWLALLVDDDKAIYTRMEFITMVQHCTKPKQD